MASRWRHASLPAAFFASPFASIPLTSTFAVVLLRSQKQGDVWPHNQDRVTAYLNVSYPL
jgi:hypothetical protein